MALVGAMLAAVHHAEVIAERVGAPFGTLVLTVAVTIIEVALIVALMLADSEPNMQLPRDTVFAAVMIIVTGMVGLCLLTGGRRHGENTFGELGVSSTLSLAMGWTLELGLGQSEIVLLVLALLVSSL
ncbi:MAG: hypothetical protein ACKODA_10765 [Nevskiaceae bacterium]